MEIRDKDAEDFCFIKTSAAIALVGRTQRVVVLKTGGQFPTPGCLHLNYYLLVRLVAFICRPFWWSLVFTASWLLVFDRFFSKIVFGTCHCCSYSGKILKSQSATCDILTWHLVHCSFWLFVFLDLHYLSWTVRIYGAICLVIAKVLRRGTMKGNRWPSD